MRSATTLSGADLCYCGIDVGGGPGARSTLAPFARRGALPLLEGSMKRIHILITQQIRNLREARVGGGKKLLGQLSSRFCEQNAKRRTVFSDTTLQGAVAHAQSTCNLRQLGPATRQISLQYDFDLLTDSA